MSLTSPPLPPKLEKIVQRCQQITEPKRRYEYLLWFAKRLPDYPDLDRMAANQVPGCISNVFITAHLQDGQIWFQGSSDAQITKGLVGFLIEGLNGSPPEVILQITPDFIQRTGLNVSLTPSRSNGFYNIFRFMQRQVVCCQSTVNASYH
ncbi:MAG: SufE family protein [Leptolyngbya sp. DLM2.Bin15]|nr:MAG: SufE family protein [Leptolyngbya sp. DLM2.Bin15]